MADNPYIDGENYYQGYNESIEALKNNPEIIELDKLCYSVFKTPDGEKFEERFLIPGLVSHDSRNFQQALTYFEGFKYAFRMLKGCVNSHEQRIKAENEKQ